MHAAGLGRGSGRVSDARSHRAEHVVQAVGMTVAVPGEDDLPRRERRVEGDRTQGLVARVDAQLGQHDVLT